MDYILETRSLTKIYNKKAAVNNLNLRIKQGEIYGFIGKNGAGKTTAMKMMCNLATPTRGEVIFKGMSAEETIEMRGRIGCLIETPGIFPNMSAYENLKAKCLFMGVREKDTIEKLLDIVNLKNTGSKKVGKFSLGMKQRLGIALALVGNPDILLLDEPINGLDPEGIAEIRELILKLNREQNITVFISSHILEELSKIATSYGIIHKGVLIKELTHDELMSQCSESIVINTPNAELAIPVLEKMGYTAYSSVDAETIEVYERLDSIPELNTNLIQNGVVISGITRKNESVEDFFLRLTND